MYIERILIVSPGHLRDQWRRELKYRFEENFVVIHRISDRTRFKRILEFIKNEVDYLVVTSLVPLEEQREIQIKHAIEK